MAVNSTKDVVYSFTQGPVLVLHGTYMYGFMCLSRDGHVTWQRCEAGRQSVSSPAAMFVFLIVSKQGNSANICQQIPAASTK